jgi:hypothetical protein
MNILVILLVLVLIYHFWDKSLIKKKIDGELKFRSWSNAYNHALKLNREKLLSEEQRKALIELDGETKKKYESEVPTEEGLFKVDFNKLNFK